MASGRMLEAEVEDNEMMNNTIQQFGSAIQNSKYNYDGRCA
jgi:hypothetical protein